MPMSGRIKMSRISLTRIYSFSAAHRLNSTILSDEENKQIFDKCNNYYGHGHDYSVEVTLRGKPNPATGMIIPLPEFDTVVTEFLATLEHKHLDMEVPYFKDKISTGENIVQYLWNELEQRLPSGKLFHIRLWETNNNYFDIGKDA